MGRPQPGQNAAVSGIWAAQWGQVSSMIGFDPFVANLIKTRGQQQTDGPTYCVDAAECEE